MVHNHDNHSKNHKDNSHHKDKESKRQPEPHSTAAGANAHKVLAERYKTKMCRNFVENGECPYESRCMFAHGDDELRTTEMNLRDGLVTEDAIKHFKRMESYKKQAQAQAQQPAQQSAHRAPVRQSGPPAYGPNAHHSYDRQRTEDSYCNCEECAAAYSQQTSFSYDRHASTYSGNEEAYVHDPYSWSPYHAAECQCVDCVGYAQEVEDGEHTPTTDYHPMAPPRAQYQRQGMHRAGSWPVEYELPYDAEYMYNYGSNSASAENSTYVESTTQDGPYRSAGVRSMEQYGRHAPSARMP